MRRPDLLRDCWPTHSHMGNQQRQETLSKGQMNIVAIRSRLKSVPFFVCMTLFSPHICMAQSGTLGQWSEPLTWPMAPVHMALLRTGHVLIWDQASGGPAAQLWDPTTCLFTAVPVNENIFCDGHAFLADGRLVVDGGTLNDNNLGIPDVNIFAPATQSWSLAAPM